MTIEEKIIEIAVNRSDDKVRLSELRYVATFLNVEGADEMMKVHLVHTINSRIGVQVYRTHSRYKHAWLPHVYINTPANFLKILGIEVDNAKS